MSRNLLIKGAILLLIFTLILITPNIVFGVSFGGKIEGKLKNTLGLFISFNGFSNTALETKSPILRSIILMDGLDLTSVLDNKITLNDLLFQKRRHAAETGEILYRVFK